MRGGFSSATLAEDTDLTIAIGRAGWRVVYVEDARGWTETPATLSGLWRQRYRWSYGTLQAVWKHRSALWRREPGKVGRRGLPYLLLFQIVLPFLAPLIDAAALYGSSSSIRCRCSPTGSASTCSSFSSAPTRSASTASRCGRSGRCRCSSSSTAS